MSKHIQKTVQYLHKFNQFAHKAWNALTGKKELEVGDQVVCFDFDKLTEKQITFLKSKAAHEITAITDRLGKPWESGIKYAEIGYSIPLMLCRFKKADEVVEEDMSKYKYKVLFIAFDIKLKTYGEEDVNKMLKGCDSTVQLFPQIFNDKIPSTKQEPGVYSKFIGYDDVYRYQNEYYVDDVCLKDYDFVFFGFMASATNLATLLVNYCTRNKIPHMKYETYDYWHNKAYQFDLLETLGFPYIPSIMTTKLTKGIIEKAKEFGYPVIVKDVYKDRGEGVWKMNTEKDLIRFFKGGYKDDEEEKKPKKVANTVGFEYGGGYNYRPWTPANTSLVLIQKFVPNDGEWRVITVKNKVVLIARKDAVEDVTKKDIDERKSKKGELPADVTNMIEEVSTHLFSDIVGFDIIQDLNTKKYYIIETNASPHFSMFSVVTNVSVPEKIVDYILSTIKK